MDTLDPVDLASELRQRNFLDDTTCTLDDWRLLDHIVGGKPTPIELLDRQRGASILCAHCPVRGECAIEADAGRELGV